MLQLVLRLPAAAQLVRGDFGRRYAACAAGDAESAAVVLETSVVGKVRGLQLRGTMARPEGEERRVARNAYLRRFPFAAVMDLELWIIRPVFFKYTDNRLGFGKKIIWENDTNS